ncbi:hypothetical protein B0A50_05318 [Salinomyces thailandicus]|uniref:Nucleolar protein 16 n=1 Tax=Salinomyces thailandicus TaxID=706561 RepID=A0A4U0TVU1_9PEZI|nr:hypothetical protein B0A50_05318 [Salinomyces thailandica]
MGRELQKKKNRSGIRKVTQKPKSNKKILGNATIAQNWDKTQTLEQNYKRLGLASKLNKHTGGREVKAEDVRRQREEDEAGTRKLDKLAIGGQRRSGKFEMSEARVERDPETGEILRVIEPESQKRANPLNDPLADLDSEESEDEDGALNQHASNAAPFDPENGVRTDVVKRLEQEASRPAKKHVPKQSENERAFIVELVAKYGDDYVAMARDMKINYMQRSEGDLKRRVKKWRQSGGSVEAGTV